MPACCVVGCTNRSEKNPGLKFFRLPAGPHSFQRNRRKLWLRAIRRENWSEQQKNARVCGAHFISGEPSMHHDSPDFVPSIFPDKQRKKQDSSSSQKKKKSLKVMNVEMGHPEQTCDQPVPPQSATQRGGDDPAVSRGAHGLGEAEQPGPQPVATVEVKRRPTSSGIQCPYCRYRCGARFSFQIHVGSQHPLHCEDVRVGRLGKVVFYQRTAKLFHCHICFFTSKDYAVLFEHLLARHCLTAQRSARTDKDDAASDTVGTEVRPREGQEQDRSPEHEIKPDHDDSPGDASKQDSLKRKWSPASGGGDDEVEGVNASGNFRAARGEPAADVEPRSAPSGVPHHECETCKESFETKGALLHHVTCRHALPKLHPCTECSETFTRENLLIRHINLQHRQKFYRCPYCVFESSLPGLHQHLSQCRAAEGTEDRADTGTEPKP